MCCFWVFLCEINYCMQLLNDFHSFFFFFYPIHYFQRPHTFLLRPVFYIIIYIKIEETIVIHCDCNLVNLYVRLKTGGKPEK